MCVCVCVHACARVCVGELHEWSEASIVVVVWAQGSNRFLFEWISSLNRFLLIAITCSFFWDPSFGLIRWAPCCACIFVVANIGDCVLVLTWLCVRLIIVWTYLLIKCGLTLAHRTLLLSRAGHRGVQYLGPNLGLQYEELRKPTQCDAAFTLGLARLRPSTRLGSFLHPPPIIRPASLHKCDW